MTETKVRAGGPPSKKDEMLRKLKEELNKISLTTETREKLLEIAADSMPQERLEEAPIVEDNVICKMMLKGYPSSLFESIRALLKPLEVKKPNGDVDMSQTNKYAMTILIEKISKKI
jgi:hypothetical protein